MEIENESINDDNFTVKTKVYKRRWLILFSFSINSMCNAMLFTCITSINNIVSKYYNVEPSIIDWAGNSFDLIFILVAFPSSKFIFSFGMRALVILAASLNAICTCFHFAGVNRNGIIFILSGQFIAGFSVGAILQVPARLSSVWFPEHEHTKATSIAMAFNVLGLGIGFLQPTYMVPNSSNPNEVYNGLYNVYLSQLILAGMCLLLAYFFFLEKPPLPPSYSSMVANVEAGSFSVKQNLKCMFKNKNFIIISQTFGLYFGAYNVFITCLNEMLADKVKLERSIGWIGFSGNLTTIISILLFSCIVDKSKKYLAVSRFLTFGTIFSWGLFSFVVLKWTNLYAIYGSYNLLSFFGVPFFVIGIEYVAEITYPVPEDISSAVILIFGNIYGFSLVLVLGKLINIGYLSIMCLIMLGLYIFSFISLFFVKQQLTRHETEINFSVKD